MCCIMEHRNHMPANGVANHMMARRKRHMRLMGPPMDPAEAARAASLRYVSDGTPGISRRRSGTGFSYRSPDGATVRDKATLRRIRSLVIPPAWKDVWISTDADGHLQATGRDQRGRKQYRYHPRWHDVRGETKYGRMMLFGHALPCLRQRLEDDLRRPGLPRDKVLAIVVRLLETTLIRVGNEEYARTNKSFGLTTLQDRHVEIDGSSIHFRFRGKGGKDHEISLRDPRLAKLVKRCRDLPGQDLFQYLGDDGERRAISSGDVNEYLRSICGSDFTAKDFRTWAGTLIAARGLAAEAYATDAAAKSAAVDAAKVVAKSLGNTVAVCRKSYIHPSVLDAYQDRALLELWNRHRTRGKAETGLSDEENALLRYLEACSAKAEKAA
jgi:DNA topoisomerase-1